MDLVSSRPPREPRAVAMYPVSLETGGRRERCVLRNLSASGALLHAAHGTLELQTGAVVRLSVAVPGGERELTVDAEVKWTKGGQDDRDGVSVGLRFHNLEPEVASRLETVLLAHRPALVVVGDRPEQWSDIGERIRSEAEVVFAGEISAIRELLGTRAVCGIVCGAGLPGAAAAELLRAVADEFPAHACASIVLAAVNHDLFARLLDEDRVFYLALRPVRPSQLLEIVQSAVAHYKRQIHEHTRLEARPLDPAMMRRVLDVLSQVERGEGFSTVAVSVERGLLALVRGERGYCLFYEPRNAVLFGPSLREQNRSIAAATGVVGFVARTGSTACVDRANSDPRYDRSADDPEGSGDERLLAVPVIAGANQVVAVLVISRPGDGTPFSDLEVRRAEFLAEQLAPVLSRASLRQDLDDAIEEHASALSGDSSAFRAEALEHHLWTEGPLHGDVLRVNPVWVQRLYQLTLIMALFAGAFMLTGRVRTYADGPVVFRVDGHAMATSSAAGTVTSIEVSRGQRVQVGQVLARLNDADETASARQLEEEFNLVLVASLRSPGDLTLRRRVGETRLQLELAKARRDQRLIKASRDGVVSDLRIRVGQFLAPGEQVGTIVDGNAAVTVAALVPGRYRPQIDVGSAMRVEVVGYAHAYQELAVTSVADALLGPEEARRLLGPDVPSSVIPPEPVVVVQARLPSSSFVVDDASFAYFDGMLGKASVRVRSERILVTLIPSFRRWLPDDDG